MVSLFCKVQKKKKKEIIGGEDVLEFNWLSRARKLHRFSQNLTAFKPVEEVENELLWITR